MDRLEPGERADGEDHRTDAEGICGLEEWRLRGRPATATVRIETGADLEADYEALATLRCIRVCFTNFSDGRGFSHARRLRQIGFAGDLVAEGDVLPDQWALLERCGFSALDDPDIAAKAAGLPQSPQRYQADALQAQPVFRRRFS